MPSTTAASELNLRRSFVEHLLGLVKSLLPPKDVRTAEALVGADQDDKVAHFLASTLFVWSAGQVPETAREIRCSTLFATAAKDFEDAVSLERLTTDIQQSGDLLKRARSHHAKSVLRRARDRTFIFRDRCFFEWGVHHFHVYPSERARDVLVYAAFDDECAYLLALDGHSTLNDVALVDSMAEACPHLLNVLNGVEGDSFTQAQVDTLRRKNVSFAVHSPIGAVAPRIPCSASGLPLQVVASVDYELACLDSLQTALDDPSAQQYLLIQHALDSDGPLRLVVVPKESNFSGTITFLDEATGKEVLHVYRT